MAQVFFSCPTMSIVQQNSVSELLLPDGTRKLSGGAHPDGTRAKPHYAGLLILESDASDQVLAQIDLNRHRVTISDGSGANCTRGKVDAIPDLSRMLNNGAPSAATVKLRPREQREAFLAASILLEGGSFEQIPPPPDSPDCHLPTPFGQEPPAAPISAYSVWNPDGTDKVTIELERFDGSAWAKFSLTGDQAMFVYNFDVFHPKLEDFQPTSSLRCSPGKVLCDSDFKWMYQLLEAPDDDWAAWLTLAKRSQLPAPEIRCTADTEKVLQKINEASIENALDSFTIQGLILTPDTQECGCSKWVA